MREVLKKIRAQLAEGEEDGRSTALLAAASCLRMVRGMIAYVDDDIKLAAFPQDDRGIELVFDEGRKRLTFEIDPDGTVSGVRCIDLSANAPEPPSTTPDVAPLGEWLMGAAK